MLRMAGDTILIDDEEHMVPGDRLSNYEECNKAIPPARREAVPGVRLCVTCQAEQDAEAKTVSGYNRRGSKDSQLR